MEQAKLQVPCTGPETSCASIRSKMLQVPDLLHLASNSIRCLTALMQESCLNKSHRGLLTDGDLDCFLAKLLSPAKPDGNLEPSITEWLKGPKCRSSEADAPRDNRHNPGPNGPQAAEEAGPPA